MGGGLLGEVVGELVGEVDGDVVGVVVPPVQVTPLSAKLVGAGLLLVQAPLKPNDVLPLVGMDPL